MKKLMILAVVGLLAAAATAFPSPEISAVQIESTKGPKARLTVSYTLSEPAIVLCDIVTNVTGTAEGDTYASIGPECQLTFTGDVGHKVEAGSGKSFVWHAGADWPSNKLDEAVVRVKLTAYPTNSPPDYLVVDLAPNAAERHRYYASAEDIPGYPESDLYRTQKLVMRFIRAKNIPWTMGAIGESDVKDEHAHPVRLRSNYWLGVFELTVGQHAWFTDGSATAKTNHFPLCRASAYNAVRGADTLYPAEPAADSYLGKIKARTGIRFELPSEAQWEYAAKAGHGSHFWGNGTLMDMFNLTNGIGLAVCSYSGGKLERAGSRIPNDWGLYDMAGNVREACLDFYQANICWNSEGIPNADGVYLADGVTEGGNRVMRGGYYSSNLKGLRHAYRSDTQNPAYWVEAFGLRLASSFGLE